MKVVKVFFQDLIYNIAVLTAATLFVFFLLKLTYHGSSQVTYLSWIKRLLTETTLGYSGNQDVSELLINSFKLSFFLAAAAALLSTISSVILAYLRTIYSYSRILNTVIDGLCVISALPVFLLAIFIRPVWVSNFQILDWYSEIEFSRLVGYYGIPILILSFGDGVLGEMIKYIKESMGKILNENYIKVSIAKNGSKIKHVFKASQVSIISIALSKFTNILGSALIIEFIFFSRGISVIALDALKDRDVNIIMAICLLFSFVIISSKLAGRLVLVTIDPRLRK